jgi:hypothetical protein
MKIDTVNAMILKGANESPRFHTFCAILVESGIICALMTGAFMRLCENRHRENCTFPISK